MGELLYGDFGRREGKIKKAVGKILAEQIVLEHYDDRNMWELAELEKNEALRELSSRERIEALKEAQRQTDERDSAKQQVEQEEQ